MSPRPGPLGLELVDAFKAAACCLIVLHHLAFYGPMSDHAGHLLPGVFAWLSEYGRLAVQVFLVLGGWLAARALIQQGVPASAREGLQRIVRRYLRLAIPLWAALVVAVACNAMADHWIDHHSISLPPEVLQVLVHLLLLQDLTGHEALSAGIWYVAIDFQLHAMLIILAMWAGRTSHPLAWLAAMSVGLVGLSAWVINRDASWDSVAPYFWCSYGLGVLAALCVPEPAGSSSKGPDAPVPFDAPRSAAHPAWLALATAVMLGSLVLEFRLRLLVAVATAAALVAWTLSQRRPLGISGPLVRSLSRISYAVFLIHFPVSLVVNAVWSQFLPASPMVQLLGVVTAFKLSILGGWVFHEAVEHLLWPHVRRLQARLFSANAA